MNTRFLTTALFLAALLLAVPRPAAAQEASQAPQQLLAKYTSVRLAPDLAGLSDDQKQVVALLIEAGEAIDDVFWQQAYGHRDSLMRALDGRPALRQFAQLNYGPWDRLDSNRPFVEGVGPKPEGANFYPAGMTDAAFEAAAEDDSTLKSLYTMVRRDADGNLEAIPYSTFFQKPFQRAAQKLRRASELAENSGFKRYLELRADALLSGDYQQSDFAWMEMSGNDLDVVVGPIETYEDGRYGYKAAAETFVLRRDKEWSQRLARYARLLPMLQRGLPVPQKYKQESPGRDSDLGAYDVLYVSGDADAGAKTIAINLPNDEEVQLEKGTRRLQLKNAMRAKFDKILVPIADELIAEDQRENITFDAFFGNTMFHEVAHGLGVKHTIDGTDRTVRAALKDRASSLEEGKADVLGLYMVTKLKEEGELDTNLMDDYVSFLASIFRSVRFGAGDAHGQANVVRFNYFRERGAFSRDEATGTYRVNAEKMQKAVNSLSEKILRLQGNGDYEAVNAFVEKYGQVGPQLQADLDRLGSIPVDITFEQGKAVLGME